MKRLWRHRSWFVAAMVTAIATVVYLRLRSPRVQFACFREEQGQRMAVLGPSAR
jgi:hypothetical protein